MDFDSGENKQASIASYLFNDENSWSHTGEPHPVSHDTAMIQRPVIFAKIKQTPLGCFGWDDHISRTKTTQTTNLLFPADATPSNPPRPELYADREVILEAVRQNWQVGTWCFVVAEFQVALSWWWRVGEVHCVVLLL